MKAKPTPLSVLLGRLQHPIRLPILVALQEGELSASELAVRVGAEFYSVNNALKKLERAGYVEYRLDAPTSGKVGNTTRRLYRTTPGRDWTALVSYLERYADDL